MSERVLRRSINDSILGGVCGGVAEFFDINSTLVRLLFIISGIGILAYLLMVIFIPAQDDPFGY